MKIILALLCFSSFAMETVKIGLFALEPYAKMVNGKPEGVMYDFLNEVDEEMPEIKFIYDAYPYNRMITQLKNRDIELAVFYQNKKAGTEKFKAFETLGNINYIIGATLYTEGLKNLKLGLIRSASYGDKIDNIRDENKVLLKTYDQGLQMLSYGRITHLVIPSTTFYDYCKKNSAKCRKDYIKHKVAVNEKNNWVHMNGVSKEKMKKIQEAHKKVIQNKKYKYVHDLL